MPVLRHSLVALELNPRGAKHPDLRHDILDAPTEDRVRGRRQLIDARDAQLSAVRIVDIRELARLDTLQTEHSTVERVRSLEVTTGTNATRSADINIAHNYPRCLT